MELKERATAHIARLDMVVKAAEIKWGVPLLLETLVDANLAAKFGRQWDALSDAIMGSRHEEVIELADGAIRGVWAMEKAALAAGQVPAALAPIGVAVPVKEVAHVENKINVPPNEFWKNGGDTIPF